MKKVLHLDQIRQADTYTIENEPISSLDLMERAGIACYHWIKEHLIMEQGVDIFCGTGNNGGDGLVIARHLAEDGVNVRVFILDHSLHPSDNYTINLQRLITQNKSSIYPLKEESHTFQPIEGNIIIDAILGSGVTKAVDGFMAEVIHQINLTQNKVLSIDIPSGLSCDTASSDDKGAIIKAARTLTFESPKLAYFWPENEQFTGEWHILNIGLHRSFIESADCRHYLVEREDIVQILHIRTQFAHKGNFGHGLLISGSYGKMGAAVLGARAALRTGAGLITAHIPARGYTILQTTIPEAMVNIDASEEIFSSTPDLSPYNAIAVGPGIGTQPQTANALKLLIQNSQIPMVFDADAINILSENKTWLSFIKPLSIFTPHLKEFERLAGRAGESFERNKLQREFSQKYGVYIVLKGAYTCISFPDGSCFFNPTGNPGMATGGSGDVLTGIILGLLAQHYTPGEAALLGAYIHGLAGDLAAAELGQESLIAGDITTYLPAAFNQLHQE